MANLTQKIETKRKLSLEQHNKYNAAKQKFNDLLPKFMQYKDDEYVIGIYSELKKLIDDMDIAKDAWLETPIVEYKTYNIDTEDIQAVKTLVANFMSLVALD